MISGGAGLIIGAPTINGAGELLNPTTVFDELLIPAKISNNSITSATPPAIHPTWGPAFPHPQRIGDGPGTGVRPVGDQY